MTYLFSTLNRYFCRIFLIWFAVTLFAISIVISLFETLELLRRAMGHPQIRFPHIAEITLLKLPSHIQLLLPFIILTASIMTLWRLSQTQELIAARSIGLSIWKIIGGLIALVISIGCLYLFVLNPLGAAMSSRVAVLESTVFNHAANQLAVSETGLWLREGGDGYQSILRAQNVDADTLTFSDVSFYNFTHAGEYLKRVDAKSVTLESGKWHLKNVTTWVSEGVPQTSDAEQIETNLTLEKIQESNANPETISFWKLPGFISLLEKSGLSTLRYHLYWHGQFAKLGMMAAMVLLGASVCLRSTRNKHASILVGLCLVSGFLLHFLGDIVYALGLGGKIPVLLAAWGPVLITLMLSASFLLHLEDG